MFTIFIGLKRTIIGDFGYMACDYKVLKQKDRFYTRIKYVSVTYETCRFNIQIYKYRTQSSMG